MSSKSLCKRADWHLLQWVWLFAVHLIAIPNARAEMLAPHVRFDGSPPFERFDIDLPILQSHFAICKDARNIVYVGSNDGVLIFDGERWQLLAMPNRQLVRRLLAVRHVGADRVYVGGYGSFGYIVRDSFGRFVYRELSTIKPHGSNETIEFADIWRMREAPEGIYFGALRDVFLFDPVQESLRHWQHPGRFGALVHADGQTLLQFRGEGFKRFTPQGWQLLPHSAQFKELIDVMLPFKGGWLLQGPTTDWHYLDGKRTVEAEPTIAAAGVLPKHGVIRVASHAPSGDLVMLSSLGKAYLVDKTLQHRQELDLKAGFLASAYVQDQELLLASSETIYRAYWPSAWTMFKSAGDNHSSLLGGKITGKDLWVFSDSDALRATSDDGALLQPQRLSDVSVYDVWVLDEKTRSQAMLVAQAHALILRDHRGSQVLDGAMYARRFVQDRFDEKRLWLLTENGLRSLNRRENLSIDAAEVTERDLLLTSLAQASPELMWAGSFPVGLRRYKLDLAGTILSRETIELPSSVYTSGESMRVWLDASGRVLLSTPQGIFTLPEQPTEQGAIDAPTPAAEFAELTALSKRAEALQVVIEHPTDPLARQWAFNSVQLFVHGADEHREPNARRWREIPFRLREMGSIVDLVVLSPGTIAVVGSAGVAQYELARELQEHRHAQANPVMSRLEFTKVARIDQAGSLHPVALTSGTEGLTLDSDDLGLRFEFALSGLKRPGSVRYRGQLKGYEAALSDWAPSAGYSYTRIRPGDYQMHIEAQDASGKIFVAPTFRVRFPAKWYERIEARLILLLCVGLVLVAVVRWWTLRRTRILRGLVDARTAELAEANALLSDLANRDALTGLANRRRFDDYFRSIWQAAMNQALPIALLVIDADLFKHYNDTHGHAAGDVLLKKLANTLKTGLRRSEDLLARYGGEEFVVVMPGADQACAERIAEQLRASVEQAAIGVTVSIGVASTQASEHLSLEQVFEAGDQALYQAKAAGRNVVRVSRLAP